MAAKELRAAAQRGKGMAVRQLREYEDEDHDDPEMLEIIEGHLACFEQVLATVRDDDDEEVTQEFCDLHSDVFVPTIGGAYRVRRFRHVVIYNGELHIGNDSTGPVTAGRLRVILSALGIELKEPQQ
jgi:hypothetical protein